jgi:polyhydroxyalkanoate synthesis regulator phasin
MSEKDARDLLSGWAKRASEGRDRLQQDVEEAVTRAMNAMGLAKRTEIETLNARIAELEQRLAAERAARSQPAGGETPKSS